MNNLQKVIAMFDTFVNNPAYQQLEEIRLEMIAQALDKDTRARIVRGMYSRLTEETKQRMYNRLAVAHYTKYGTSGNF